MAWVLKDSELKCEKRDFKLKILNGLISIEEPKLINIQIEITKLYSLHKAATILDHAVKEHDLHEADWRLFNPSRFIYS